MQPIELISYPKVNIFLKIIQKRDDGYHLLSSRFMLAHGEIHDVLCIESSEHFSLQGEFGCLMQENTIFKAKLALAEILKSQDRGEEKFLDHIKVSVQKNIPAGSGLGGGSSNAASFILGVQRLLGFSLSQSDLVQIAKACGADVMFFLSQDKSANVYGIGDYVHTYAEDPLDFEIHTPHIFCSTPQVYARYAYSIAKHQCKYASLKESNALESTPSKQILQAHAINGGKSILNDLFLSACSLYTELKDIADDLGDEWFFSGSGSSFFRLKAH